MAPTTADKLEIKYIKKFDSYKNGYNSTIGGEGIVKYDAEFLNKIVTMYNNGYRQAEISEKLGCCLRTVARVLKKHGIKRKYPGGNHNKKPGKKVECFDLKTGETVQQFESKYAAGVFFKISDPRKHKITEVICGKRNSWKGYGWREI